jgi:hypothetical protein
MRNMTEVFEIKNGVYNIRQYKEINDPNYVGNMFVGNGYKVHFLVWDNRYPQDECLLIPADEFEAWKEKGIRYQFGFIGNEFATPKLRTEYVGRIGDCENNGHTHLLMQD